MLIIAPIIMNLSITTTNMYLAEIGKLIMFRYKTGLSPDIFQNTLEAKKLSLG